MTTGAWALVPARSFRTAKSRLGGKTRAAVARALFDRVVGVLAQSRLVDGIVVATDGGDVAGAARVHRADALIDLPDQGLAQIIDRGLAHLTALGARAAVVVMADLPLLGPRHVEHLLGALDGSDLALAPDRDQAGTNALALRLPAAMPTCFGNPDSLARHLEAARRHGLGVCLVRAHGLAFDVDHPADLDELVAGTTPKAEARVPGQLAIGSERVRRIGDTVERIAAIVDESRPVRAPVDAEDGVERVPLGGRPPRTTRDPS